MKSKIYNLTLVSAFLLIAFLHINISAQEITNPMFGPEFTFTNSELIQNSNELGHHYIRTPKSATKLQEWREMMEKKCKTKGCKEVSKIDRYGQLIYQYIYPDGFHYTLTTDPAVIEINMRPLTIEQVLFYQKEIVEDIFELAERLDLRPHEYYGGGSIHMDIASAFAGDTELFLDFLTDYANHYYLSTVAMGKYMENAPPLLELFPQQIEAMRAILADPLSKDKSIEEISQQIISEVYFATKYFQDFTPPEKYQALNLDKILGKDKSARTVEIRGIRAQRNLQEYIKVLKIFRARVNFLKLRREHHLPRVQLVDHIAKTEGDPLFIDPFSQYIHYIKETGLAWQEFADLFPYYSRNGTARRLRDTPFCLSQLDRKLPQPQKFIADFFRMRSKL